MLTLFGEIKGELAFKTGIFTYILAASNIPDIAIILDTTAKDKLKSVCKETTPCCKFSTNQCLSIPNNLLQTWREFHIRNIKTKEDWNKRNSEVLKSDQFKKFFIKYENKNLIEDIKKFKNPEFCEWRWINPIDCLDLVVPFKRTLYKKVLKNFRNLYQE